MHKGSLNRWLSGQIIPKQSNLSALCKELDAAEAGDLLRYLREQAILERDRESDNEHVDTEAHSLHTPGRAAGPTQLFATQDEVYIAAATALERALSNRAVPRSLDWAALHGMAGTREDDTTTTSIRRFDRAVKKALTLRSRSRRWTIRQVFNVQSELALDGLLDRLLEREECGANYEVWAYSTREAPPVLSPLILCARWLFLAPEDERALRVASGLLIADNLVGAWARAYFDQVLAEAPFHVRSAGGINAPAIDALRARIRDRAP